MNKKLFILISLVLLTNFGFGQDTNEWDIPVIDEVPVTASSPHGDTVFIDTSLYTHGLPITRDTIETWKKAKAYAYTGYLDSLLRSRKDKPEEKVNRKSRSGGSAIDAIFSSSITQYILWGLAALFVLFIIYKLFLADAFFTRQPKKNDVHDPVEEELINTETDFDRMIRQALAARNYRLAVRYQYLRTLHGLADHQLLELAADKTNYQYVRELKALSMQNDFAALTLNYEYVWYGEFNIDETLYSRIETGFKKFNQALS